MFSGLKVVKLHKLNEVDNIELASLNKCLLKESLDYQVTSSNRFFFIESFKELYFTTKYHKNNMAPPCEPNKLPLS